MDILFLLAAFLACGQLLGCIPSGMALLGVRPQLYTNEYTRSIHHYQQTGNQFISNLYRGVRSNEIVSCPLRAGRSVMLGEIGASEENTREFKSDAMTNGSEVVHVVALNFDHIEYMLNSDTDGALLLSAGTKQSKQILNDDAASNLFSKGRNISSNPKEYGSKIFMEMENLKRMPAISTKDNLGSVFFNKNQSRTLFSKPLDRSVIENDTKEHMSSMLTGTSESSSEFCLFDRAMGILSRSANQYDTVKHTQAVLLPPTHDQDVYVRIATSLDDVDIANLRLSVFSDFSPELQSQFCARSCQAIAARRVRGAICIVAVSQQPKSGRNSTSSILGTAECSFHEFIGTELGYRRHSNSMFYITEVAVNPIARRCGVGMKLLFAIDTLATGRGVDALYLHVDVKNLGAIRLYEKCGYCVVTGDHPMYDEFTRTLNLHPGATKGRNHFLMRRNLRPHPSRVRNSRSLDQHFKIAGSLGFDISS